MRLARLKVLSGRFGYNLLSEMAPEMPTKKIDENKS